MLRGEYIDIWVVSSQKLAVSISGNLTNERQGRFLISRTICVKVKFFTHQYNHRDHGSIVKYTFSHSTIKKVNFILSHFSCYSFSLS